MRSSELDFSVPANDDVAAIRNRLAALRAEQTALEARLAELDTDDPGAQTGRYVGEGFDDARLDTLFLTMPIAWRGTLAQYAGRLHRIHPNKREVIVYDYVDGEVPVLARMSLKRITGFKSLGYSIAAP